MSAERYVDNARHIYEDMGDDIDIKINTITVQY